MGRRLHIAPEIAQVVPAAYIAHLEAQADDDDNVCGVCLRYIATDVANVYVARDREFYDLRMAHPKCHDSVMVDEPGLRAAKHAQLIEKHAEGGVDTNLTLIVRPSPDPRAVLVQELRWLVGNLNLADDPLESLAERFGLVPVGGYLDRIHAPRTTRVELRLTRDGMELIHEHVVDQIPPFEPAVYAMWRSHAVAAGRVLLIIGRGLQLDRADPELIGRALHTQPCWGGVVDVDASVYRQPPRASRRARRRRRGRRR